MTVAARPPQIVGLPTAADLERLRAQRTVVEKQVPDDSMPKYATPAGKLGTIGAILSSHVFAATQTYELQCLGVVFGDALMLHSGMEWVTVEDDAGVNQSGAWLSVYQCVLERRESEGPIANVAHRPGDTSQGVA